jgi:hypothetical protein
MKKPSEIIVSLTTVGKTITQVNVDEKALNFTEIEVEI